MNTKAIINNLYIEELKIIEYINAIRLTDPMQIYTRLQSYSNYYKTMAYDFMIQKSECLNSKTLELFISHLTSYIIGLDIILNTVRQIEQSALSGNSFKSYVETKLAEDFEYPNSGLRYIILDKLKGN